MNTSECTDVIILKKEMDLSQVPHTVKGLTVQPLQPYDDGLLNATEGRK